MHVTHLIKNPQHSAAHVPFLVEDTVFLKQTGFGSSMPKAATWGIHGANVALPQMADTEVIQVFLTLQSIFGKRYFQFHFSPKTIIFTYDPFDPT